MFSNSRYPRGISLNLRVRNECTSAAPQRYYDEQHVKLYSGALRLVVVTLPRGEKGKTRAMSSCTLIGGVIGAAAMLENMREQSTRLLLLQNCSCAYDVPPPPYHFTSLYHRVDH